MVCLILSDLRYPLPLLGGFFMGFSMLFHVSIIVFCYNNLPPPPPLSLSPPHHLTPPPPHFHFHPLTTLLPPLYFPFPISPQLVVYCSGWQYIMAERLLHWLQEFQTTVDVIEEVLPSTKPHLNRLFSQVLSFPKAYESMCTCTPQPYHYSNPLANTYILCSQASVFVTFTMYVCVRL